MLLQPLVLHVLDVGLQLDDGLLEFFLGGFERPAHGVARAVFEGVVDFVESADLVLLLLVQVVSLPDFHLVLGHRLLLVFLLGNDFLFLLN